MKEHSAKHNRFLVSDYERLLLSQQDETIWKDWVGRTSDIKHGNLHGIHQGINNAPANLCLIVLYPNDDRTDDQNCGTVKYGCATNTQPYSRRTEYNSKVLNWLGNPGNNCGDPEVATCANTVGSYTCECGTGLFPELILGVY